MRESEPLVSTAKALSVVTPCKTREQFIERYHRFCDDTASFFVATKKACAQGQDLTFSFQLADRTAILRGAGSIEASFPTSDNPWQQPGIKIRIRRMTANSTSLFAKLQLHAAVASIDQLDPAPALAPAPAPELVSAAPEPVPAPAQEPPALAPEPARSRAPLVRFATSSERQVDEQPAGAPERDASDAPLVDLVECVIYEATNEVVAADEDMIDFEPARRVDETPLAFPVQPSNAPARSWRRFLRKPHVAASLAASLVIVIVIASVTVLRRDEQPSTERVVRRSAAANPYVRHTKTARLPAAPPRTSSALPVAPAAPTPAPAPSAPTPSPAPPPPELPSSVAQVCSLHIVTSPPGASIRIDGRDAGLASRPISIACGPHDVEISRRRYATATHSVVLTPDRPHRLEVSLARPVHTVSIETTPPDAQIAIAGELAATSASPIQIEGFRNVTLTISKPGWRTTTRRVYSKVPHERLVVRLSRR